MNIKILCRRNRRQQKCVSVDIQQHRSYNCEKAKASSSSMKDEKFTFLWFFLLRLTKIFYVIDTQKYISIETCCMPMDDDSICLLLSYFTSNNENVSSLFSLLHLFVGLYIMPQIKVFFSACCIYIHTIKNE